MRRVAPKRRLDSDCARPICAGCAAFDANSCAISARKKSDLVFARCSEERLGCCVGIGDVERRERDASEYGGVRTMERRRVAAAGGGGGGGSLAVRREGGAGKSIAVVAAAAAAAAAERERTLDLRARSRRARRNGPRLWQRQAASSRGAVDRSAPVAPPRGADFVIRVRNKQARARNEGASNQRNCHTQWALPGRLARRARGQIRGGFGETALAAPRPQLRRRGQVREASCRT